MLTWGFIDPVYKNMLDHVDHTIRIIRRGFHPPFWWFADLAESARFIDDLDPDLSRSIIRYDRWSSSAAFHLSNLYFSIKHGHFVQNIPNVDENEVDRVLTELKHEFGCDKIH